jgi:polysaccharide pyruvyl transferase WcaK-like protein
VQTPEQGLEDIIRNYYCRSELVIATRLHGAITAYGLGIPYLALPGDEKVREFHRLFGGGKLFNNMDELAELLAEKHASVMRPDLTRVLEFGAAAKQALEHLK